MSVAVSETSAVNLCPVYVRPSIQVLVFQRQGRLFAMPLAAVRELKTVHEMARTKSVVRHLKGVCKIGGSRIPVMDVVDHDSVAIRDASKRLIVISHGSRFIAIMYDKVLEILPLPTTRIVPPADGRDTWPTFGLDEQRVAFLEPSRLLDSIESASLDTVWIEAFA